MAGDAAAGGATASADAAPADAGSWGAALAAEAEEREEREEREAASESEADSDSGEAVRDLSHMQALLDSIHIDINNEGFDDEDMEEQMGEEDAAARAADEMVEGFWA